VASLSQQKAIMTGLETWAKSLIGTSSSATVKVADSSFYQRKFPWDKLITHPACILLPVPERLTSRTNRQNDYGHGVQITLTKASNRDLAVTDDDVIYWRELLFEAMADERIPTIPAVWCQVEPGAYFDLVAFGAGYDASAFTVRANRRYTRQ
jgi:hypothetical protein